MSVPRAIVEQSGTMKTGISAKNNLYIRKRFLESSGKITKNLNGTISPSLIAGTQFRPEQLITAKNVERQKTMSTIKTIVVFLFLITVNAVVRRIEIKDELFRRRSEGSYELFDEKFRAFGNFFVGDSIFESRKSWSGTEGRFFAGFPFDTDEQSGIVSQVDVIIDIFVAEGDGEDSLGEEIALLMDGVLRIAGIVDGCIDLFDQLNILFDLLEEERSGIGCEHSAIEVDDDRFGFGVGGGDGNGGRFLIHCVLVVGWWNAL